MYEVTYEETAISEMGRCRVLEHVDVGVDNLSIVPRKFCPELYGRVENSRLPDLEETLQYSALISSASCKACVSI